MILVPGVKGDAAFTFDGDGVENYGCTLHGVSLVNLDFAMQRLEGVEGRQK